MLLTRILRDVLCTARMYEHVADPKRVDAVEINPAANGWPEAVVRMDDGCRPDQSQGLVDRGCWKAVNAGQEKIVNVRLVIHQHD